MTKPKKPPPQPPRKRSRWLRTTDSVGRHPTAWKSAVAVLGSIGAIVGGFLLIDEHYEKSSDAKAHAQADDVRALWSQLGTTQLRSSFLEDKVYDLAAKQAALGKKLPIADQVSLERYRSQLNEQAARIVELRRQIDTASRTR